MKRNRNLIYDEAGPYFVTTAIDRFIPVFAEAKLADIAINNLDFYRKKYGCKIYAYVIMPDHLHLIVDMHGSSGTISAFMRDYKSMVAVQVMDELRKNNRQKLCGFELLDSPINSRDQKYRFWGERFDAILIFTRAILEQKLKYIHENPVRKGLVRYPEDYLYSSAGQYLYGKPGKFRVDEILW